MEEKVFVALDFANNRLSVCLAKKRGEEIILLDYIIKEVDGLTENGMVKSPNNAILEINAIFADLEKKHNLKIGGFYFGIEPYSLLSQIRRVEIAESIPTNIAEERLKSIMEQEILLDNSEKKLFASEKLSLTSQIGKTSGEFFNIYMKDNVKSNIEKTIRNFGNHYKSFYRIAADVQAEVLLSEQQKQDGCMLVDFGGELTSFVIYKNSVKVLLAVVPLGGKHISQDLATRFSLTEKIAEKMKLQLGKVATKYVYEDKRFQVKDKDGQTIEVTSMEIAETIEARQCEIFNFIMREITQSKSIDLFDEIVIVGGSSGFDNMSDFLEEQSMKRVVRLSMPEIYSGTLTMDNPLIFSLLMTADQDCRRVEMPKTQPITKPEPTIIQEAAKKPKSSWFEKIKGVRNMFEDENDSRV